MATATLLYKKAPKDALRGVRAFSDFTADHIETLLARTQWLHLQPGERLTNHLSALREREYYLFLQQGQVALVSFHDQGDATIFPTTPVLPSEWEVLTTFEPHDLFSSLPLTGQTERSSTIDCAAIMESVLAAIPAHCIDTLAVQLPDWKHELEKNIAAQRDLFRHHRLPEQRVGHDFYVRHGYSFAKTLKVIELNRCIECNACETACGGRHGFSRLVRKGPTLGRLGFPTACRTCEDHRCLAMCGFDALSKLDNGELYIDTRKCVGCSACKSACPNGVIEMVQVPYDVKDFPKPMPKTDANGETNVQGLFLVGEAAGAALIKLAMNAGVETVKAITERATGSTDASVADVVIVGAGPAGLAAGLACMEENLSYVLLDKGHYAMTIQTYPRNKLVMAEPALIPKLGTLWMENARKEEIIEKWDSIIEETGIRIRSHEHVTDVQKDEAGIFTVVTGKNEYRGHHVIIAVGTRGTPRKMGVPGEEEPRVLYTLTEPEPYEGKHVLVVGGGDSAVEGAMTLADVPNCTVTLSYRRDSFGRIKGGNRTRLEEYESEGKLRVILKSNVVCLEKKTVVIKTDEGEEPLPNDQVFAMLGGEPPTKFFEKIGIQIIQPDTPEMEALAKGRGLRTHANKCDHCCDYDDGPACLGACPTGAILEIQPTDVFADKNGSHRDRAIQDDLLLENLPIRKHSIFRRAAVSSGLGLALFLVVTIGIECFLRILVPEASLLSAWQSYRGETVSVSYSPGQGLGYYLGWSGFIFMAITSLYPLQSRLRWLDRFHKSPLWLVLHIVAGLTGPAFVTYHTQLKLDRWPAISFWCMWAVVLTGSLGRYLNPYLYARIGTNDLEVKMLEQEATRLRSKASALGTESTMRDREYRQSSRWLRRSRVKNRIAGSLLRWARRFIGWWRWGHIILTVAMFVVAFLHIAVALTYRTR